MCEGLREEEAEAETSEEDVFSQETLRCPKWELLWARALGCAHHSPTGGLAVKADEVLLHSNPGSLSPVAFWGQPRDLSALEEEWGTEEQATHLQTCDSFLLIPACVHYLHLLRKYMEGGEIHCWVILKGRGHPAKWNLWLQWSYHRDEGWMSQDREREGVKRGTEHPHSTMEFRSFCENSRKLRSCKAQPTVMSISLHCPGFWAWGVLELGLNACLGSDPFSGSPGSSAKFSQ